MEPRRGPAKVRGHPCPSSQLEHPAVGSPQLPTPWGGPPRRFLFSRSSQTSEASPESRTGVKRRTFFMWLHLRLSFRVFFLPPGLGGRHEDGLAQDLRVSHCRLGRAHNSGPAPLQPRVPNSAPSGPQAISRKETHRVRGLRDPLPAWPGPQSHPSHARLLQKTTTTAEAGSPD